ncbi:Lar family restriction alleviation protein [Rhizobium rhizogenes]|uniref:Lar family restriction alleviation protein n=1 Tax=Rhizobium rhizogenes TaxID=359 RepID=UPI0022702DCD|nr:Lar family restriction alleviation protein [Rhizobium rhizogenes]
MPNEILPCPFCGSDEISHGYQAPPYQGTAQCHDCGAAIIEDDEEAAIKAWNRRASPSDAERHERAVPEPIGYASDYGLEKLASKAHWYCLSVSKAKEKEYVHPIYAAPPPPAAVQEPVAVKAILDQVAEMLRVYELDHAHVLNDELANLMAIARQFRSALFLSQSDLAPEIAKPAANRVKLTKEGAKDAALDLVRKNGWKPGNSVSLHSAVQLMVAFGLMVDAGEVQCDWPNCGCCADAACRDAVAFMDTEAEISALREENELLGYANVYRIKGALELGSADIDNLEDVVPWAADFEEHVGIAEIRLLPDTAGKSGLDQRAAVAPQQEEAK